MYFLEISTFVTSTTITAHFPWRKAGLNWYEVISLLIRMSGSCQWNSRALLSLWPPSSAPSAGRWGSRAITISRCSTILCGRDGEESIRKPAEWRQKVLHSAINILLIQNITFLSSDLQLNTNHIFVQFLPLSHTQVKQTGPSLSLFLILCFHFVHLTLFNFTSDWVTDWVSEALSSCEPSVFIKAYILETYCSWDAIKRSRLHLQIYSGG